jgi:uncharacterized protein YjiS (DUF1127 family)
MLRASGGNSRRHPSDKDSNMAHTIERQRQPLSITSGLRNLLAGWRRELAAHRVFERTYNELASLTDRELADIGVSRSQIVDISWDAARRS